LNGATDLVFIKQMPLDKSESKAILVNLFRLSISLSEKRTEDAVAAYSKILDYTLFDSDDDMPPLIPLNQAKKIDEIDLIISEIKADGTPCSCTTACHHSSSPSKEATVGLPNKCNVSTSGFPPSQMDDLSDIDNESDVNVSEKEEEVAADEVEEEVGEEKEEEDAEEEEEEVEDLPLESVRIKKVFYWKNTDNGDIYKCLPDGELGEKVGRYVDDKPVFD